MLPRLALRRRLRLALLLLRREGLVELLLARVARSVRPDHRLRIILVLRRRGAERHSVLVDHRLHAVVVDRLVAEHLLFRR